MGKDDKKKDKKGKKDKKDKKGNKDKKEKVKFPPASKSTCVEACSNYLRLYKKQNYSLYKDVLSGSDESNADFKKFLQLCPSACTSGWNEFQAFGVAKSSTLDDAENAVHFSKDQLEDKRMKKVLKSYKKHLSGLYEEDY